MNESINELLSWLNTYAFIGFVLMNHRELSLSKLIDAVQCNDEFYNTLLREYQLEKLNHIKEDINDKR